jgi:hypothetical protein
MMTEKAIILSRLVYDAETILAGLKFDPVAPGEHRSNYDLIRLARQSLERAERVAWAEANDHQERPPGRPLKPAEIDRDMRIHRSIFARFLPDPALASND